MDCTICDHYNQGHGQPLCLKCKKYKDLQIKSARRQTIKTEHIPQAIMDNIADPRTRNLMDIIAQLPLQYAVPLMMRATLGASLHEIADYHNLTRSAIQRRVSKGCKIITKSLTDG
jgi:DNA-directed RNA polymerase specialized sigma24 family protein